MIEDTLSKNIHKVLQPNVFVRVFNKVSKMLGKVEKIFWKVEGIVMFDHVEICRKCGSVYIVGSGLVKKETMVDKCAGCKRDELVEERKV